MSSSGQYTVMIVDDSSFTLKKLKKIFTDSNYLVVGEALTGQEAVEKYQVLKPDLVTMDIVMPYMDGIEATKQILRIDPDARIVMISSLGMESKVQEAANAGAKTFVLKPFTADTVLNATRELFAQEQHAKA